jgi:hypothetical protein
MATNTRTGLNSSGTAAHATSDIALSLESFTLGTDGEGYDHHYYRPADAVVVYDQDDVDHVKHLDGRPLAEWADYVDHERGWTSMGTFGKHGLAGDLARKEGI